MFRKRKPAKQLSAEELKSKLYAHFDKSGSLNQMRTEIRGKLVTEIFKMSPPAPSNVDQLTTDFDKTLLPLQVCNWLVYDHLLRQGYQYALSTFVTEANVPHPERLLTACDILGLFRLDSGSPEYKSISKMYSANNEQGLLHSLLLAVIKSLFDFSTEESMNQSTNVRDTGVSIKETTGDVPFFERIDSSEIPKFNRESFTRQRNKSADSSFHEQLQLLKEEKEKEIKALRQKWLEELDRLHSQERAMKEEIDNKRREIQRELDGILSEKEKLKEKEFFLIKEHENKLEKRIRELETDHMSKIHSKESEIKISQGKLYDKELRIAQVETDFATLQTDCHSLKRELEEIKQTYKITKEKYSALLDENTKLLRKFESMSDYAILKGDLEACSKEISGLHQQFDESKGSAEKEKNVLLERIRSLETKLKHKESQLLEAQRQLNLCRDTLHREESIWHKERRKLEQDSQESKEMYKTLIRRLEEQREDIQALHHTIHILHFQLTDTDKRSQTKPDTFVPQRTTKSEDTNKKLGIFRLSNNNSKYSSPKYSDDSLKFIEEAKGRIKNLEKEAHTLRDKCSAVFCHVPGLQDMHSHKSTANPLVFNSTNIPNMPTRTFQFQSYNNRFETLIRNEMPALDSCLQTHVKSQFINAPTDLHFPKTSDSKSYSSDILESKGLHGNKIPFSDLSSLNLYQRDFVPTYALNCEGDVPDGLKVKSFSQSKEFSERPSPQQPTDGISSIPSSKIDQNSDSTEKPTNIQSKQISLPLTRNTSETCKENRTDTALANLESTAEVPSLNSFTQFGQTQSSISSAQNTIQSHSHYFSASEKESRNETASAIDDASRKESSLNNNSALKPDPRIVINPDSTLKPDPPIVIDLDSAWKRKTSLKDDSESQSVPSILSGLDSAWKRRTSLMMTSHSLLNSSLPTLLKDEKEKGITKSTRVESEQVSVQNKGEEHYENKTGRPKHTSDDAEIVQTEEKGIAEATRVESEQISDQNKSEEHYESKTGRPKHTSDDAEIVQTEAQNANSIKIQNKNNEQPQGIILESKSPVPPAYETESKSNETKLSSESFEDNRERTDTIIEKQTLQESKQIPEDSLSEPSDIHLSCGSEQEQQKEDSDNW